MNSIIFLIVPPMLFSDTSLYLLVSLLRTSSRKERGRKIWENLQKCIPRSHWKITYTYIRVNAKHSIRQHLPIVQGEPSGDPEIFARKIQPQTPTHDFPRLTGNYRRERSAAFEVNLLACRMQNRRQTAAPGAPSNIFHSYLHFIVNVSFSLSSSRDGLWPPLSLMPATPFIYILYVYIYMYIRSFVLISHENTWKKYEKC